MSIDTLTRVKIAGFKSIKSCDVELGKTNVLIGANGVGKTNFISAFSFLQAILSKNLQISVARAGVSTLLFDGRKTTDEISLEFDFGQNGYGVCLVPTDDNSLLIRKEYLTYDGSWRNESNISRAVRESQWDSGVGNGIDLYALPVLKRQSWRVYHFHDTSRGSRVKQEQLLAYNTALAGDASNLAAFLYMLKGAYPQNYRRIVEAIRLAAPFFSDFVLIPSAGNGEYISLRWRQVGCEDVFGPSQFSDGTLRFACLATLFLQPTELQPATIIVDEPELGLHPYAIGLLAEMIRALPRGRQSIVSTQSVELLNEFDVGDVLVADRDEGGSRFSRVDGESLRDWVDDYSLGELWKMNLIGGRPRR